MKITIHSIQKTLYAGMAEKLVCQTPQGQITILDHHLPLITKVMGSVAIAIDADEEKKEIPLSDGILEVRPGSDVIILTDS